MGVSNRVPGLSSFLSPPSKKAKGYLLCIIQVRDAHTPKLGGYEFGQLHPLSQGGDPHRSTHTQKAYTASSPLLKLEVSNQKCCSPKTPCPSVHSMGVLASVMSFPYYYGNTQDK